MQEESRRFPRLKFSSPLRFQIRGSPDYSNSISENISLKGIGFANSDFVAPLTPLMLEINLFSRILRPIAKVVWAAPVPHSNRYHLGAEFTEFQAEEQKFLADYLRMKLNR